MSVILALCLGFIMGGISALIALSHLSGKVVAGVLKEMKVK